MTARTILVDVDGVAHKRCPQCSTLKALDEYPINPRNSTGRHSYCKPCSIERKKASNARVRQRIGDAAYSARQVAYKKTYRKRHPERLTAAYRHQSLKKFGLTCEEYDKLFASQDGLCAICREAEPKKRLAIDHSHATGALRGLLCSRCNTALGLFADDIGRLIAASDYLRSFEC